ncbi:MAG: hypothetical protein E7Z86_06865 [Methanosphaera stadtmanae]|nr:hypothetical protein [Methanosphaera stadtmanae]
MDCNDDRDYQTQFTDFLTSLNKLPFNELDNIKLFIYGKNKGHQALPQHYTLNLLNNYFKLNKIGHKKLNEKYENKYFKFNEFIFELPLECTINSKNTITKDNNTIYFNMESENKSIETLVQNYKNFVKKHEGIPFSEKINDNNIPVYKVGNKKNTTVRYYFSIKNKTIQIFTYTHTMS